AVSFGGTELADERGERERRDKAAGDHDSGRRHRVPFELDGDQPLHKHPRAARPQGRRPRSHPQGRHHRHLDHPRLGPRPAILQGL
ncbi:MAG: hypothetical protein AVDCRST_MAG12-2240, partial [uncultured Rubrobacteraceae bacterium]